MNCGQAKKPRQYERVKEPVSKTLTVKKSRCVLFPEREKEPLV